MPSYATETQVVRVQGESRQQVRDWLAKEEPLEVRLVPDGCKLPGLAVSVTMRTPGHDFELAVGFLYAEGIIGGRGDIRRMMYCGSSADRNVVNVWLACRFEPERLRRHFYMSSACGVCGKTSLDALEVRCEAVASPLTVTPDLLQSLPDQMAAAQAAFKRTGGLHAAALFDADGRVVVLREDVGRHNAVDKLIGHALLGGLDMGRHMLMVSGRTSFEIMQKAAMAGFPVVAAISAPSSLAVEVAKRFGITLVGFMRKGRFNVYAGAERVGG